MRTLALTLAVFASVTLAGCDASLNRELSVPAGAKGHHGAATVNGRITVGAGAEVVSDLRTVNGAVSVGRGARLHDLDSVNGSIEVGDDVAAGRIATVNGDLLLGMRAKVGKALRTVNGRLRAGGGSIVDGDVGTVNGPIELRGVTVRGQVVNHAGDLRLLDGTLVEGDVRLAAPDGAGGAVDVVVIGVGAQVRGTLWAERPVRLFVHPSARLARVEGVSPQPFEGTDVTTF
jgi:DUF4097 and DUF4098 domain-containing protein YvlB